MQQTIDPNALMYQIAALEMEYTLNRTTVEAIRRGITVIQNVTGASDSVATRLLQSGLLSMAESQLSLIENAGRRIAAQLAQLKDLRARLGIL